MASINDVEISEGQGTLPVLLGRTQAAEQDDPEAVGKDGEKEHDAADRVTTQPSNMEVLSETTWAEKLSLVVGGILALAQGVSTPLIAVFTADSIGLLTTSDPSNLLETMTPVLWKIGILAVAQFLLAWWWQWCMHWSAAKQASRWHIKFIKQLMTLDVPWYDANDSAGLAARLQADIGALYIFMSAGLGFLISCAGQFFAGITLAFVKSWQLSLAACAVTPFLVFTGHRLGKEIEEQYSQQAEDFQRASTVAEESLMAIRTVVAFGGEASAMRRFERELTRAKMGGIRSGVKIGIAWGGLNFVYNVLYALTLWLGGHVLMKEGAPLEESRNVVVVMIALIVGVSGISMFSGQAPVLARAIASAKGMKKVINCRAHDIEPEGFALPPLPEELQVIESVEFKSVCFRYPMRPDQPVLKNLSFEVKKGQKIALVGESGCGKSTTIQLLERFYDPEAGEILINGIPLFQLPVKSWRKLIGFVGQEPVLFATSAMNNLRMGDDSITEEEAIKAAKDAQIYEALSVLPQQFDTFVGLGGNLLSGGQRQRVAIARALAKRPQILLLDEATSALDNESERMVQETLDALQSNVERSLTTISIAHRLTSIMASDVIYVLKDGAVCEHGTHDDLVNMKAVYYNMAALQREEPQEEEKPEAAAVEASYNRGGTMMSKASTQTYIIDKPQEQAAGHTSAGVFCRLFRTARPDWVILPFLLLVVLLSSVATPFQALFFNQGIGGLFMPEQLDFLNKACLGLIMTGFVGGAAVMLQNSLSTYLQENLSLNLRKLTFESIIYLDIGFFDAPENQVGSILVSLERHMTRVAQMLGINLANTVGGVLTCVICVIFSFFGSWILAVALLIMMPLFTFMGIKVSVLAHIPSKKAELAYAVSGQTTTEAATQIRTVRALGAEKQILEILSESLQVLTDFNVRTAWKKGAAFGLTTVLIQVMYLAGFWLSAGMIQSGAFDSNQVLLTLFCVVFGVMSVSTLSQYLPDSASGHLAVTEVFRLIDQDSKINCKKQKEGGIESFGDGSIVFKDVNFWYPHRPEVKVLKHVSFSVQKGQSVALVGFSGSGKSTVIQLLQRFYDPQGGCILVGGQNLRNFKLAWWRRNIGMVSQEEPVLFDMSLEENVKYGYPEATPSQVQDAARIAHMEYAFNGTVKWTDRVGLRGEKLSGGQKQRCAIARALLRRPQILLLDEATSALDSHSERLVQDAMQDARVGKTTITVAHRLSTIRSADMILVLNGGKLVERGTYSELIALEGAFSKLARSL